jgi:hypothetical protein
MRRALALLVFAGACRVAPPVATQADADRSHVELAELSEGRATMIRKCGSCHKPPLPRDHTALEWPAKLDEMSQRANLDVHQRRVIEKYLIAMTR